MVLQVGDMLLCFGDVNGNGEELSAVAHPLLSLGQGVVLLKRL